MTSVSYFSRIIATALTALGLTVFGFLQHLDSSNFYAGEPNDQSSSEQQGLAFINARCTICHSSDLITQQQLDRSLWTKEVDKMIKWGAPVRPEEQKFLLDYLSAYYSPQRSMGSSSAETERQLAPYK
jgi:mono/diheme cytochrome c family protein